MMPEYTDPWPEPFEPMEEEAQLLQRFRRMAASFGETFAARQNHVHELLGAKQNYASGVFREGLLRDFLREILPRGVAVDAGFIYGFERVPNSAQLDIIVWDAVRHAPVYRTDSFVIVPPESVVSVVSVKTGMGTGDLKEAMDNLRTVTPLDLAYRTGMDPAIPPISKFVVAFGTSQQPDSVASAIAKHVQTWFASDERLTSAVISVLAALEPTDPSRDHKWQLDRELPRLIISLDARSPVAFIRGWGPPDGTGSPAKYGVRRLPYLYQLGSKVTSAFEKFVYNLLADIYLFLDTRGWSLVSAWGDFHPRWGFRVGDAREIMETTGVPLINLETSLAPRADEGHTA